MSGGAGGPNIGGNSDLRIVLRMPQEAIDAAHEAQSAFAQSVEGRSEAGEGERPDAEGRIDRGGRDDAGPEGVRGADDPLNHQLTGTVNRAEGRVVPYTPPSSTASSRRASGTSFVPFAPQGFETRPSSQADTRAPTPDDPAEAHGGQHATEAKPRRRPDLSEADEKMLDDLKSVGQRIKARNGSLMTQFYTSSAKANPVAHSGITRAGGGTNVPEREA